MGALQQKLHVNITIVDIGAVFKGVLANPAQFGLDPAHTTQECIQNPACVANHQNYLFWDDVHPTEQVQQELSEAFFASLTGPTTVGPEIALEKIVQQDMFDHISARTAALRLGVAGLTFDNVGGASGTMGGDGDHGLSAFITDSYGWGSRDGRSNVDGFDYTQDTTTAGVDYRLNDWSAAGVMIGYSETNDDFRNSLGSQSFDSYQAAIYATAFMGGWYSSLAGTYAYEEWGKLDRNVFIGNQTASASTNGHVLGGKVEGGYVMRMGDWSFGPAAELRAADYRIGSYTEHGAVGLNQEVDGQSTTSLIGQVGLQAALSTMIGDYAVTPQVRLGFDHEFHNTTRAIVTRIASQLSTSVTTDLEPDAEDWVRLGVGVDVKLNDSFSALVDFDSTVGRSGGEDYSALARLKAKFLNQGAVSTAGCGCPARRSARRQAAAIADANMPSQQRRCIRRRRRSCRRVRPSGPTRRPAIAPTLPEVPISACASPPIAARSLRRRHAGDPLRRFAEIHLNETTRLQRFHDQVQRIQAAFVDSGGRQRIVQRRGIRHG